MQWILKKIVGTKNERDVKKMRPQVNRINEFEETYQALSDEELKAKTQEFRSRLEAGETVDDLLPEAFAAVKNACRRLMGQTGLVCDYELTWDMVPYDVQLIGGIVLHEGKIAEMATGEGKTLVATLPVYLNALSGNGVHVVTVNDYLAKRDSDWMGTVFRYLGLTVGCIQNMMPPPIRRENYNCDITYGTNSEFGFDYLRDNMAVQPEDQVQRGYHYSVIDEIDSILIDEARTPLIISGPAPYSSKQYQELQPSIDRLVKKQRDLSNRIVSDAKSAIEKEDLDSAMTKLYQVHCSTPKNKQFLKLLEEPSNRKLLEKADNMYVTDMHKEQGRGLREELYFNVVEKDHSAHLTNKGIDLLAPNNPEEYVMPDLADEQAILDADETLNPEQKLERHQKLQENFAEKSEKIHAVDQLIKAYCLYEKDVSYVVQENQVMIVDENTGRLMPGRRWSDGLHQAVEAKEGVKIERETQTLATITIQNYFRMYDKLSGMTGTAETEADEFYQIYKLDVVVIPTNRPVRRIDFNDLIYKTQREKYNAVLDEITECHQHKQPILVGTISVEVSELLSRMLKRRNIPHNVLNAKNHLGEAEVVRRAGQPGAVTIATNMAGRGTDIKLSPEVVHIPEEYIKSNYSLSTKIDGKTFQDLILEQPSGLRVIATERHESRRIDRQLRGRSARQGDPGMSRFYVSLEDSLMRLFGSERISSIMEKLGIEEGQELEHSWLNKSIERAQKRVEEHHFSIRKRTLEYDDVMNAQREVIYGFRSEVLQQDSARDHIYEILQEVVDDHAEEAIAMIEDGGLDRFKEWVDSTFPIGLQTEDLQKGASNAEALSTLVYDRVKEAYELKMQMENEETIHIMERHIVLQAIDTHWQEYLRGMDTLRQGVGLRAYGQQDPIVEYKREAYDMFAELMDRIKNDITGRLFRSATSLEAFEKFMQHLPRQTVHKMDSTLANAAQLQAPQQQQPSRNDATLENALSEPAAPIHRDEPKVGRNDPCSCGSGKKYKKCCGAG